MVFEKLCDIYLDRKEEYASLLSSDDVQPWVHNLNKIDFAYWNRYKKYG